MVSAGLTGMALTSAIVCFQRARDIGIGFLVEADMGVADLQEQRCAVDGRRALFSMPPAPGRAARERRPTARTACRRRRRPGISVRRGAMFDFRRRKTCEPLAVIREVDRELRDLFPRDRRARFLDQPMSVVISRVRHRTPRRRRDRRSSRTGDDSRCARLSRGRRSPSAAQANTLMTCLPCR